MSHDLGRRQVCRAGLLAAVGTTLAACGAPDEPRTPPAPATTEDPLPTAPPTTAPAPTPSPAPALPRAAAWQAGPGEVHPELKLLATEFVERAGSWRAGAGSAAEIVRRLRADGASARAAATAGQLAHPAEAAVLTVLYPQYGGLTGRRASVMLHAEQALVRADGDVTRRQLQLDVRLDRGRRPVVTGIEPRVRLGARQGTSATAREVLEHQSIALGGPAADDVRGGHVHDDLLEILLGLADGLDLEVQVFRTGHPLDVFDTGRTSNHTRGRAVDIRKVDGMLLTVAPRSLVTQVLTRAGRLGATEVGGPFDLNGGGPGYFTDQVHQDHVHVAVTAGRRAARP